MEALSGAEVELASFRLILEESWTGESKGHLTALETAVEELDNARSKFERMAAEA